MGSITHNSIEKYDYKENKWKIFGYLSFGRSSSSVHIWKDKLYILGGINSKNIPIPLEIFDCQTKKSIIDKNIILQNFSSASILVEINHKPYIFIAGGKKQMNDIIHDKVYSYSIEDNSLNEIASLNIGRIYNSLIVFHNELYCIGGHDQKMNYKLPYEKYNFIEDKWEIQTVFSLSMSGSSFLSVENHNILLEGTWKYGIG